MFLLAGADSSKPLPMAGISAAEQLDAKHEVEKEVTTKTVGSGTPNA
jgi:hypothetical protein